VYVFGASGLTKTASLASLSSDILTLTHARMGDYGSALVASLGSTMEVFSTHSGTGRLSGSTLVSSVNGMVNFTDLGIDLAAAYTLVFSPKSLSDQFPTVRAFRDTAVHATVTVSADVDVAGLRFVGSARFNIAPVVQAIDAGRNDVAKQGVTVTGVMFNPVRPAAIASGTLPSVGAKKVAHMSIPGEGRFIAVANQYNNQQFDLDSAVYKMDAASVVTLHQLIPTRGAYAVAFVKLPVSTGFDYFLAVANHFGDADKYAVASTIYRWNATSKLFIETQSVATYGATHFEPFVIGSNHYLAVANYFDGTYHSVPSAIYQWSRSGASWRLGATPVQELPTTGAHHVSYFEHDGKSFLFVAEQWDEDNMTYATSSVVFKRDTDSGLFVRLTTLPTQAALYIEPFVIGSDLYLAVANSLNAVTGSVQVSSPIYKMSCVNGKETFTAVQQITTRGATRWKYFNRGGLHHLAVAHWVPAVASSNKIVVYVWDTVDEAFVQYLEISSAGAFDVEMIKGPNGNYLIESLPGEPQAKLRKIVSTNANNQQIAPQTQTASTSASGAATFGTLSSYMQNNAPGATTRWDTWFIDFFSEGIEEATSGPFTA
jgi:hypothetical protein